MFPSAIPRLSISCRRFCGTGSTACRPKQLLRQPDGFEGVGSLFVGDKPDCLVIANGPHLSYPIVDLCSAASATPPGTDEDDDLAARRLDELLRFEAELLEGFSQLSQDI